MLRGTQSVGWPTFGQYCMVDRVTEAQVRIRACQINGMISGQYANVEPHLHLRVSCRQGQQLYLSMLLPGSGSSVNFLPDGYMEYSNRCIITYSI